MEVLEKMKEKRILNIFLIVMIFLTISNVSAVSIVNVNYDFNQMYFSFGEVKSSSVLFRLNTPNETNCYYTAIKHAVPQTSFENNYGIRHEQLINNFEDGVHRYYFKCQNVSDSPSPVLEVVFIVNAPVFGEIKISKTPPLKEGTYELTLTTSKQVSKTPKLDYSFDGISYKPIVLQGSGNIWKGYLIIESNLREAIGSFRFEAEDLSGIRGNELIGDSVFLVDTIKPPVVETIEVMGDVGQIRLKWFYEKEFEKFNIYKSKDPNVGYIHLYKTISEKEFIDNDVEKGKTYYYRISAIDKADNIGDLSREISATALLGTSVQETGLRIELRGKVDNFISEVNFAIQLIDSIKSSISLREQKDRGLFQFLKLDKDLDSAKSELNSIKRDAESYKLQDLTREELDNRLNSVLLKLNIIRKNIPENLVIVDEVKYPVSSSEGEIQEAILNYNQLIDEKEYKKSISLTEEMIRDSRIKILTSVYLIEVSYLDGTRKDFTIVEHEINSLLEKEENSFFILKIPRSVAEKASDLKINDIQYEIIKDDVVAFYSDAKKISYSINKKTNFDAIKEVQLTPVRIQTPEHKKSLITGGFLFESSPTTSYGIIIVIVFFIFLGLYLVYFLKNKNSEKVIPLIEKIEKIKEMKKEDNLNEINLMYQSLKEDYRMLNERQRKIVLHKIDELKNHFDA